MRIIKAAFWLAILVLIGCGFVLVAHLSTNNLEFSRYNTGWNGTSSFYSDLDRHDVVEVYDAKALSGAPKNSTLLIIAPYKTPDPKELAAYRTFLDAGNTVVIADDFGTGNAILRGLESRITILPGNLSSLDRRYTDPYMVVAYPREDNMTMNLPASIALDRAAAVDGGDPLMLSSVMSWIDKNGDRRLNMVEDMGMFPVLASERAGTGKIIVLSDPSIFVNTMYTQGENADNRVLIRTLLEGDGRVFVDQMNSRTADASGISGILHVIRTTISIEIIVLCLPVLAVVWAWKRKLI